MNYSCTAYELKCNECGKRFGNQPLSACPDCLAPLEVAYDLEAARGVFTREAIAAGPPSIWRYAALLPIPAGYQPDLPVGFTPLIKANNLGKRIGATNLYIKNDAVCFPTLSFKDRVVSVALANAQRFGFDTVGCSSTGNLANSVAAQAARLGIKACILVPAELEAAKILNTQVYGARLVRIDGNYDHVNRLCSQIADEYNWGFVNVNLRPYYAEGSKTVGYEIAEKLGWRLPDNVIVPMAGGSLIRKIRKAFQELVYLGLVEEKHVRFFGAQATGCSPISQAVKLGNDFIEPQRPNTIARSLAIGNPADGPAASQMIRATGGWAEDVSDVELVSGMQELAETEGIFTETAGGVTTAVTARLYAHGRISPDELTVACITGNGLKTTDALTGHYREERAVRPRLADFDAYLRELDGAAEPELAAVGGTHGN
ncbi:MAG TPA: threonine synthase [Edaphobacter sp.]|uniref:threonine synthase n=1 Tax=Edaphobacter sp. TaxID=1934404 RepID=UPI002CFD6E78|nr:threonine synthase [Edaphobacter sp.]HUZ94574.1 threonine synthase [Edaphobacter sp.]